MENSVVTITGGTGSFGKTVTRDLIKQGVSEIRIFSRDETKQDEMRREFKNENIKFYLGDTRDRSSIDKVVRGSDYIFHAAALKQVPSCEFFPEQAIMTNVLGSKNVIDSGVDNGVKSIVCLSTDKAVYPINTMGMTKALMEKVAQSYGRNHIKTDTTISVTRYGNVMCSRGSVIPVFFNQLVSSQPITLTDPSMTRFLMKLDESVDLVKYAFQNAESGDIFVRKAKATNLMTLAQAIAKCLDISNPKIDVIGDRHGEKKNESLLSKEELIHAIDHGDYFRVPLDSRDLNYSLYLSDGISNVGELMAYESNLVNQLSVDETSELLMSTPEFIQLLESK